jgi:hypothetical protein
MSLVVIGSETYRDTVCETAARLRGIVDEKRAPRGALSCDLQRKSRDGSYAE